MFLIQRFLPGITVLLASAILGSAQSESAELKKSVSFNRDIRPILSNNCYACHGPDKSTRKAKLRVDNQKDAHAEIIVPGKPEESEFGRTIYCQGKLTQSEYGRDHHPKCFTMWMAGGGVKPGIVYGETDEFSHNVVNDPVHIHQINATILHLMGIDAWRFSMKVKGLDARLTGATKAEPVNGIMA